MAYIDLTPGVCVIPSGKVTVRELEHGPFEIVDFPIKNGGSFQFAMLNYQRVLSQYYLING